MRAQAIAARRLVEGSSPPTGAPVPRERRMLVQAIARLMDTRPTCHRTGGRVRRAPTMQAQAIVGDDRSRMKGWSCCVGSGQGLAFNHHHFGASAVRFTTFAVLASLAAAPAYAADPVGSYSVQGANPGGDGNYRGTVTVTRTSAKTDEFSTFRVIWVVDGARITGTAIGNDDFLAVTYMSGQETGLAVYGAVDRNWGGFWTTANGTQLGNEVWTRR